MTDNADRDLEAQENHLRSINERADTNDTRVAQDEKPRPEGLRECQEIIKKKLEQKGKEEAVKCQ